MFVFNGMIEREQEKLIQVPLKKKIEIQIA